MLVREVPSWVLGLREVLEYFSLFKYFWEMQGFKCFNFLVKGVEAIHPLAHSLNQIWNLVTPSMEAHVYGGECSG